MTPTATLPLVSSTTSLSQMYVRDGNIPDAEAAKGNARILSLGGKVVR